ncbi:hypothetical protein PACTADRAFT_47773 [Pachysolen tannophilus NRRL Y-2460]|uniref:2-dehydropantoate 2-reductase n=1 Tax=Pachysolen tannophilus NRRL Y-2460 TaxID=669874 RepID=A0A1E4U1Q6_PACTA|nr:hypothetical protein PACTADRAFT_47773 [Pachysolen tannophilus NRRL Y-2460]
MFPSKVYVLGVGSIGCLVSTQLAKISDRQIVLLLKDELTLNKFLNNESTLRYENLINLRNPIIQDFKFKALSSVPKNQFGKVDFIENLIVTTKSYQTLRGLEKFLPALNKNSKVLFIQNGLGVIDKLNETLFADPETRPQFYQGIISHGAFRQKKFAVKHVGLGDLKIAALPRTIPTFNQQEEFVNSTESEQNLVPDFIQDIIKTPILNAQYLDYEDLLVTQYEKLIINSCINPITAILDSFNGELLKIEEMYPIFSKIIQECIDVLTKSNLNTIRNHQNFNILLNKERLINVVFKVAEKTSRNSSSMREDIRSLNETEIDYVNGYVVELGKKYNVYTPYNRLICDLVKAKLSLNVYRNNDAIKMTL